MTIFTEYKDGIEVEHEGFTLKLEECPDDDADLSYLGEFSNSPSGEFVIEHEPGNHRTFNWFNPANAETKEQAQENYKRAASCGESWYTIGIKVVVYKAGVRLGDASLWGVESDSDDSYKLSVANV